MDKDGMYNPMPHRIQRNEEDFYPGMIGGQKADHKLFGDYISLLNPENTADMHSFAITNLD
jgi:hypothetical protein